MLLDCYIDRQPDLLCSLYDELDQVDMLIFRPSSLFSVILLLSLPFSFFLFLVSLILFSVLLFSLFLYDVLIYFKCTRSFFMCHCSFLVSFFLFSVLIPLVSLFLLFTFLVSLFLLFSFLASFYLLVSFFLFSDLPF